jgi:hypothetical protein
VGCQAGPECNCVIEIATWAPDLEDQVLGQPVRQADFLKPGCQPNGCWAQIGLESVQPKALVRWEPHSSLRNQDDDVVVVEVFFLVSDETDSRSLMPSLAP